MKRQILSYSMTPHHRHAVIATRSVPNVALSSPLNHGYRMFHGLPGSAQPSLGNA